MGFPRRLLGPDEQVVYLLRPHVKVLFRPFLLLLLLAAVTGALIGLVPAGTGGDVLRVVVGGLSGVVFLRWVLWPFLVWWNTVYLLTTERLVLRRGVLNRSGHDMPLTRLNDVSFAHTLWERLLGCGTLVVESAGERGQLVLDDVPRVEEVQRALYELSDEARDGEGRAGDDVDGHRGRDR